MECRTVITYFMIVCMCCLSIALPNEIDIENSTEILANDTDGDDDNPTSRKWVSELFYKAWMDFRMDSDASMECKKDFDLLMLHFKNQSTWAVKMMESSEWPFVGILSGKVDHMGNYDECLSVSSYGITGRYCLAEAKYDFPSISPNQIVQSPDERVSVWEYIDLLQKNPARKNRKKLKFAMCIPSSCKPDDLKNSLNNTLFPLFETHDLQLEIDVNPALCSTKQEFDYSMGFIVVGMLLSILFLIVIGSSLYDRATPTLVEEENMNGESKHNFIKEVTEMFSLPRNFSKLKKVDNADDPALDLPKFLNMLGIVFCHRTGYIHSFPQTNSIVHENMYFFPAILVAHASFVDVFFLVSGFLTFHTGLSSMMKNGRFYLYYLLLVRWIRMVPVFGVLMLYMIYIFPYTGHGPIWNYNVMDEIDKCKESWWTYLLAVNNIVKTDQQCLINSWHIGVDIQLTIMGAILLYIFSKNEKLGIFAVVVSWLVSTLITFTTIYNHNLYAVYRFLPDFMQTLRIDEYFNKVYIATYSRCGPYLLGFFCAYVVKLLKERKFKFTNVQIYLALFISLLISEGSQIYGCVFYIFDRQYDKFENALYGALHRSLYVLFYAVSCCLYFTSGLGVFTKLVQWKTWSPLGRLSYSVFLINVVIQLYFAFCQKDPVSIPGRMNVLWWFCGDVVFSYFLGLIVYLFLEAPILNTKTMLKKLLLEPAEPKLKST